MQRVYEGSGAWDAGLKPGDLIVAINGRQESTTLDVKQTLGGIYSGERVRLTIVRAGSQMEVDAGIRDMNLVLESENDAKVNGPRSERLSGFERVIQHDTVLDPDECGGPVLDSSGRAVGLNIARAGRVVSYALPASLVIPEMVSMLQEARESIAVIELSLRVDFLHDRDVNPIAGHVADFTLCSDHLEPVSTVKGDATPIVGNDLCHQVVDARLLAMLIESLLQGIRYACAL